MGLNLMSTTELLIFLILVLVIMMVLLSKFFEKAFIAFGTLLVGGSIGFVIGHIIAPVILTEFTDYGETGIAYFAFLMGISTTFMTTAILRAQISKKKKRSSYGNW